MTKESTSPGPARSAPTAVSTKMPVPITAPTPSNMSWIGPSERSRPLRAAVSRLASTRLIRQFIASIHLAWIGRGLLLGIGPARRRLDAAIALHHAAADHHEGDLGEILDICVRLAIDDDDVRQLAGLEGAEPVGHAEDFGIGARRRDQGLVRLVADPFEVLQLLDVGPGQAAIP